MAFTSYAEARGFDPIQIPTEDLLQRMITQSNYTLKQLEDNEKLRRQFSNDWISWKMWGDNQSITNIRTNQKWADKNKTRIQNQHLKNLEIEIENVKKQNPQSRAAVTDKLQSVMQIIPQAAKQIGAYIEQENKARYQEGLSLINELRATPAEIGNLRAVEGELWDANKEYIGAAQVLADRGASEADLHTIRNASGWLARGIIEQGLSNAVPDFHQHILNNYDTPYDIGNGTTLTLNQAWNSSNVSAANNILGQLQTEFAGQTFAELGMPHPDPAWASEFFEKLDKISDARFNDIHRAAEEDAREASKEYRRVETYNALDKGGLPRWFSEVINGYEDPRNKNWRRNAIRDNFPYVEDYLKRDDIPISVAQEMLTATREDGKTPLLGYQNQAKVKDIIQEKLNQEFSIREASITQRKLSIQEEILKVETIIRDNRLNNEAKMELWQEYKDFPEIREYIQSTITDTVSSEQNDIERARLEYAATQGELTTQMVLQSKTNEATKLQYLGDKRIDDPYPETKKNLKSDITNEIQKVVGIKSFEDLGAKEPSVRMATESITQKAMQRYTNIMREGNVTPTKAYEEAFGHAKALIEQLNVTPFSLDDPSSGFIEGYTVDANEKPISTTSRLERRALMDKDTYFYKNTPLDTKQDYEFLRQKLLSGGSYDSTIEDKFPWVRDVVGLYNGRLTREEILQENAKILGVNLVFPKAIQSERSNLQPGTLKQVRINARELNSYMSQTGNALLEIGDRDPGGWRTTPTYGKHLRHVYDVGSVGRRSTGPHLHIQIRGGGVFSKHDFDKYIFVDDPELGRVPLGQTPTTDDQEAHWARGSDGWDFGLYEGTDILIGNGAKVIEEVQTSTEGTMLVVELPDGRIVELLHGTAVRQ